MNSPNRVFVNTIYFSFVDVEEATKEIDRLLVRHSHTEKKIGYGILQ